MSANEQKTSRELAIIAAQAADEKKATDILVQDVAELVGETDFFVIVTASNSRQVNSIVDAIKEDLRDKGGVKPFHVEGTQDGSWSLLDYGQIVVHVFQPETREYIASRSCGTTPPCSIWRRKRGFATSSTPTASRSFCLRNRLKPGRNSTGRRRNRGANAASR